MSYDEYCGYFFRPTVSQKGSLIGSQWPSFYPDNKCYTLAGFESDNTTRLFLCFHGYPIVYTKLASLVGRPPFQISHFASKKKPG